MEAPAKKLVNQDRERESNGQLKPARVVLEADQVKDAAAKLYGLGFRRPQVAQAMIELLSPSKDLKAARKKLSNWEQKQEFRDKIWQYAVVKMDLETPEIIKGITRSAKRGRVDAAKLALAVTSRHVDKSDMPSEVVLRIDNGMPRPDERAELHGRQTTHPQLPEASTTDGAI